MTDTLIIVIEAKVKDWEFDAQIGLALRTIFQNPNYIPSDPYKVLIYILRSNELKKSIHMDYSVSRVKRQTTMSMYCDDYIKSTSALGTNSIFGLKHISKLVDETSLKNVLVLLPTIRDALGNLPAKVTTKTIEATFVECSSINDGLAASLMTPRVHNFEVTIEAIVKGVVFDDCLVLFIRRVIEEAYCAGQSKIIMSKNITVTTGKNRVVQTIPIKTVKTRRQQILSLLKTAIIDEGEIYVEMFLKVKHLLPLFDGTDKLEQEPTEGFIYFKRIYKFNYIDENGIGRCFSRYPFQSLSNCIFFDNGEFELFLKVFRDNVNRVREIEKEKDGNKRKKDDKAEDPFLENIIDLMAQGAGDCIEKGDVIPAVEWLYQLQALQCADKKDLQGSVCIMQLASLGSSWAGQCRAIQDVAFNVRSVYALIADGLEALPSETKENKHELREEAYRLEQVYKLLASATIELKGLLIDFVTNCPWSEIKQMRIGLLEQMWKLFDPITKKPILDPDPLKVSKKRGLPGTVPIMRELDKPLANIVNALAMLEASLGSIILSILLEKDEETYDPPVDATGVEIPEPPRDFNVIPNRISELLGYIEGRRKRHIQKMKINKGFFYDSEEKYKDNNWTPYVITGWLRYLIYGGHYSEGKKRDAHDSKADEDLKKLYGSFDSYSLSEGLFLDITSKLSINDIGLFGCMKLSTCINDEISRYDVPKVVVSEAVRIRYLSEAHVLRALHEAIFLCINQPQNYSPYSTLCSYLYKFSAFLQIYDGVSDKALQATLYDNVRHGRLNNTANIFKAARITMNIMTEKKEGSSVEACLVGPYSLLCGLGETQNIWRLAWMIPPMLIGQPSSPAGMRVKIHSGLSAETALHWGNPRLASLRSKPIDKKQARNDVTKAFYVPAFQRSSFDYMGRIQLEVVIKVTYEAARIEAQIKQAFASIVTESANHLSKYPSWRFLRILSRYLLYYIVTS